MADSNPHPCGIPVLIIIDFFSEDVCQGTDLCPGFYYFDDSDDQLFGGPFPDEQIAKLAIIYELS
jgi:hypothetical protein